MERRKNTRESVHSIIAEFHTVLSSFTLRSMRRTSKRSVKFSKNWSSNMWRNLKRTNSSGIWVRLRRTSNWADTPICLKSRSELRRWSSSIKKISMNCGTSPTQIISMKQNQRAKTRNIKSKSVFTISLCTTPFSNLYTVNNRSTTSSKTTHLSF